MIGEAYYAPAGQVYTVAVSRAENLRGLRIGAATLACMGVLAAGFLKTEASGMLGAKVPVCVTPDYSDAGDGPHEYKNIQNMRLTCEGLKQALSNIDMNYYDLAQNNPKFNPMVMAARGISQGPTEFHTLHVTAGYYNSDGTETKTPVGEPSVPRFIDVIDRSDDPRCCGVNQYIDRNGTIYWLAPSAAKLRHNPGYDGVTTGKEMEGFTLPDLSVKQLEASAYVDLGNRIKDGLAHLSLQQLIRGHAETRAAYKRANPNSHWPAKQDWYEGPTAAYRQKLQEFINANPDLHLFIPPSFLTLP